MMMEKMKELLKQFAAIFILIALLVISFSALAVAEGKSPGLDSEWHTAIASWYGPGFYNQKTACGEIYTEYLITVAHKELPCDTIILIELNRRFVYARVNDRGPYWPGRELDLSAMTAKILGFSGVQEIQYKVVYLPEEKY